jgi:hypothetical protein
MASATPAQPAATPEQPTEPAAADPATTRIAILGGPPVVIDRPAPEKAARSDPGEARKKEREKQRAEDRARRRRLAARRARLARQAAQAQLALNPFGQATQTTQYIQPGLAGTTARTR